MVPAKKEIKEVLKAMSSNKSLDEIMYNLYFEVKLAISEDDFKNGRFITLEELDKEMEGWYANKNIKNCRKQYQGSF
ncbi:MAG: hypothetical protein FWF46_06865 [Oscillospiraceae bacterium]|nr:hypothetical protein [Oscillospiraceae bacterium]